MEWKDYAIIGLLILVVGGPIGVHVYHRGKGVVKKGPQVTDQPGGAIGGAYIDDNRRLGMAVAANGGKTVAEGAKLVKMGSSRFHNREQRKDVQLVGGA